jgi:hypothetical protein
LADNPEEACSFDEIACFEVEHNPFVAFAAAAAAYAVDSHQPMKWVEGLEQKVD